MYYKKNIKDIHNVDTKGGDLHTIFMRKDQTHFSQSYIMESPDYNVCEKCGELINNGSDHDKCEYDIVDELYVAQFIEEMFVDDKENVIEINKGYDDHIYISMK